MSMLEVLAHLAQGDIPLLSAARTRRRVSPQPEDGASRSGVFIQIIVQSCKNNAPLKGSQVWRQRALPFVGRERGAMESQDVLAGPACS